MAIIYTYPTKAVPNANDLILISDSEDSNKTKQVAISTLPGGSGSGTSSVTSANVAITVANPTTTPVLTSVAYSGGANIGHVPTGSGSSASVYLDGSGSWSTPASGGTPGGTADNQVQYKNGTAFAATDLFTYSSRILSIGKVSDTARSHFKVYGGGSDDAYITLYCSAGTHGVTIEGPDHTGGTPASYTVKLPNSLPNVANQILESNASGVLSWIATPSGGGAPGGGSTQFQYNNGTTFAGTDSLRFDADKIHMGRSTSPITRGQLVMYGDGTNASDIQLYNGGNNRFLKLAQQDGATQDLTLTFPGVASGGNNKILESDSSGQLSWIDTPAAGSSAVTSYTNAGNNRILTSSGTGVINGESSLVYNGSILTLGTNSTLEGSRNNTDNVQTTNGIIELSNTGSAYGYQSNIDSNANSAGAARHIIFRYNGSEIGFIRNASINSVAYSTSASDERKKKNIVNWNEKVLEDFLLIEPKKFNYLNEKDSDDLTKGFIAQQMVDKFPEAYPKDQDTVDQVGYYSFNPSGMTVYLMKAIKELKEEIDTLTERVKTLEG